MRDQGFNYGRLMQRAMRGLMAEVLSRISERGLPGDHHFFISFDVTHPGVDVPDWLRAEHPKELSIILQYEFSDLAVTSDRFSVSLSFGDRLATLVVPFDAVKTFADPSENFGLRFDATDAKEKEDGAPETSEAAAPARKTSETPKGDAEVVSLDSFRKK